MNYGDLSHRVTIRLNDAQFAFICNQAEALGVSPSNFVRMLLNSCMVADARLNAEAEKIFNEGGENVNENIKANKHNII